ncbi:MAG: HIT family protein [Nanoarchaeota archaeon]|nr:HIT family protein [Nanoarchaeota archaeon]
MKNCIFCKIVKGEIPAVKIWEDEKYYVFLDENPINPGHTLVVPKKHTDYVFDLTDDEYSELMLTAKKISKKIKYKMKPKKVGMVIEGFGVPHIHVHLIPINHGNELNPENAKPAKKEELEDVGKRLRG